MKLVFRARWVTRNSKKATGRFARNMWSCVMRSKLHNWVKHSGEHMEMGLEPHSSSPISMCRVGLVISDTQETALQRAWAYRDTRLLVAA